MRWYFSHILYTHFMVVAEVKRNLPFGIFARNERSHHSSTESGQWIIPWCHSYCSGKSSRGCFGFAISKKKISHTPRHKKIVISYNKLILNLFQFLPTTNFTADRVIKQNTLWFRIWWYASIFVFQNAHDTNLLYSWSTTMKFCSASVQV